MLRGSALRRPSALTLASIWGSQSRRPSAVTLATTGPRELRALLRPSARAILATPVVRKRCARWRTRRPCFPAPGSSRPTGPPWRPVDI
eukprot:1986757-Pyramimonas_sp.AAC.1